MISTGIAPHLQLARYYAVRKIWHKSDFSAFCFVKDSEKGIAGLHVKSALKPKIFARNFVHV